MQFFLSTGLGLFAAGYVMSLPGCATNGKQEKMSWKKVFGLDATIGMVLAQQVVNQYVDFNSPLPQIEGWSTAWFIFAGYMLVVALLYAVFSKKNAMINNPSQYA